MLENMIERMFELKDRLAQRPDDLNLQTRLMQMRWHIARCMEESPPAH